MTDSPATQPRFERLRTTFGALKHPNYRLWYAGQVVSLFGTWMQNTAQGFLIYELTRSPAFLGYVGFANGLPSWLFSLYGGVVADRLPRRRILLTTQSCMMALAFILSLLTFSGTVEPWHVVVLTAILGAANAFDAPARLAFVPSLVPREDLTNAIALNATIFNTATIVGPAAAGVIYAVLGPGWCFALNGLSFLAVIAALALMRLPANAPQGPHRSATAEIRAGLRYAFTHPVVKPLLLLLVTVSLFGASFGTLYPAWSVEVLAGDATTNGLLRSAQGVGALMGALTLASLGDFKFRGRLLTLGLFAFPVALGAFSLARWLPLSLAALAGVGVAFIMIMNTANALVQGSVNDEYRGRVMAVYSLTFFGGMPLGALLSGQIAAQAGAPTAVAFSAASIAVCALLAYRFAPRLRGLR